MLMSPDQEALIGRVFESYLTEHHHEDILQLIAEANEETHRPVVVNAMTLFEANMEVGDFFNTFPNDVLAIFDKVLNKMALELSDKHHEGQRTAEEMKPTLHARITGLPVCPELTRDTIPRSRDVGHFLSVTGTVIRTSVAKVLEYERDYMCSKCRHIFTQQADFEQFYTFVPPAACPNPDGCNSYKFSCLSGGSEPSACRDFQEIKIQEQVQRLSVGSIPRSMVVVLEDDLVDSCKSGDDVTVYGVMCQRWKPFYDGTRCDVELVLKANNMEVNNQQTAGTLLMKDIQKEFEDFWSSYKHDPMAGRNQILLSLCPQVFGMYVIKLAVAMVLAGGVQRIDASGTRIRGECHMLLVGDPGTAKSQFLKYAAKVMPRSVLTAGIGSTSAGLTVAAVKDGGDWHLEAGALVLSDGGLCCIDEFNSIKEHDRISIHEAMEQQSISVAKAGMVCKLNTRTSILAAANPKGQYDPNEPLSVNVALASPLLSRFDLVLVLLDTRNAEWDHIISSFILEDRGLPAESASLWSMEKMKAYFSVIKHLQPQLSDDANHILTRYYQLQRQSGGRNAARTTIRMLESLSRLAEAHARLMYRETVTIEDAVIAVSVMECSMQGGALLGNVNALLTSFPDDPGQQYQTQCQLLLEGLDLPHVLQKEMDRLDRLRSNISEASQSNGQHQVRETNGITKARCHDITSDKRDVTMDSGLDWFHAIASTPLPTAAAQENQNRKPNCSRSEGKQPHCQTEKDSPNSAGSSLNHGEVSTTGNTKSLKERRKESSGCVLQKVSKNLRDRRRELNQQHGGRVVSSHGGTDRTLDVHCSSPVSPGKKCSSAQDNLSSSREGRSEKKDRTRTEDLSTVLKEQMAAGAGADQELHAKLSGFMFKPRKMRATSSDTSAESQTVWKLGNHDDSADPPTHTEKSQRQKQDQSVWEGGGRKREASCVSEVEETGSEAKRVRGPNDGLTQDNTNHEVEAPLNPSSSIHDPAPSISGCTKPTVASLTLARLSRFSFTSTPTVQPVEKSPPKGDAGECSRANPKAKETVNLPEHSPSVRKMKSVSTAKNTEPEHSTEPPTANAANHTVSDGPVGQLRKRRCFELGPPLSRVVGSKGPLSGLSLFDSDLSNDVLDTDWDQEVSKKAKK